MIHNFGRNVSFTPEFCLTPRTEAEVLQILEDHRDKRIRVAGRLHSWSEAARSDEVLLDLQLLNSVQIERRAGRVWASVGAGCQIKKLLADLEQLAKVTTPSVGLITEQSIAGAIATGTHGSGKHSLSHDIAEIRIATFDPVSGQAVIRTIEDGPELKAARCSLGCLGVILSVGFWCRPQYNVEEHFARYTTIEEVLAAEDQYPLQQFYFTPWSWDFFVQHRREVQSPRSRLAGLYRLYCLLNLDICTHLSVIALAQFLRSRRCIHIFFRRILPLAVVRNWKVVDRSYRMLTMKHELFRHIEIEVFVKRSRLSASLTFVEQLLRYADGDEHAFSDTVRDQLLQHGLWESLAPLRGRFTYHYVICVRKVLPDETLISMASSDDEPYYAMSFISFARTDERDGFFCFAKCLADCLVALDAGRPHWGKVCPLTAAQADALYPHLPEFRRIAHDFDESGQFQNDWVAKVLFGRSDQRKGDPSSVHDQRPPQSPHRDHAENETSGVSGLA